MASRFPLRLQFSRKAVVLWVVLTTFGGTGCSLLPDQKEETKGWTENQIFQAAKAKLNSNDNESAIKYYQILESRYPFGKYSQQGQLDLAYAYYKNEDFEQALSACDRFIKMNPSHPSVDYAYYMKGLVNYKQKHGILERMFPTDPSTRDPGAARQAFFDFKSLLEKFPNSKYSRDAKTRMVFLRNNLAKHEIVVARHYISINAHIAAVNRAKYVIENYDSSPSIKDALAVLVISYEKLGLNDLARDSRRVLEKNYPDHPLLKKGARSKKLVANP